MRAFGAELRGRRELLATVGARPGQRRRTFLAELGACFVLVLAAGTLHGHSPRAGRGSGSPTIACRRGRVKRAAAHRSQLLPSSGKALRCRRGEVSPGTV